MDSKYLIINSGSASHKHALYEGDRRLYFIHFEAVGDKFIATEYFAEQKLEMPVTESQFVKSVEFTIDRLDFHKIILAKSEISRVGIRVVSSGEFFQKHQIIDSVYCKNLKRNLSQAPLHITSVLKEIKVVQKTLPKVPIIGVSDSAFHIDLPLASRLYAIPTSISKKYGVYRYGYHGLSLQSVSARLKQKNNLLARTIICHLGGGASITALLNSKSIDTSMGFSPGEGLVMATRSGDIDPGAVAYLSDKLNKKGYKILDFLEKESGLLGLSNGQSSDIRNLLQLEQLGNVEAKIALDLYAQRVRKFIGAYATTLGGVDVLVFAGTVGERSFPMRERICKGLEFLGIKLDSNINNATDGVEADISATDSTVKVLVIKTDEMAEIAKETAKII